MQSLSAHTLLDVWERGLAQSPVARALLLAGLSLPEASWAELAELSIGRRDSLLFGLREQLFGQQMAGVATCPACGEKLEFSLSTTDLRAMDGDHPDEPLELSLDDYCLQLRLPNSADLLAATEPGATAVESTLLARCVSARRKGRRLAVARLPDRVRRAIDTWMAAADPLADIQIELVCPTCGHGWPVAFDIVSFLWRELEDWAMRTLRDVHDLARAYAWREADILSLSSLRRQLYLEMTYG